MNRAMSIGVEIERKFLVSIPVKEQLEQLNIVSEKHIVQTYLHRGKSGTQRRVRSIRENDQEKYYYTEKQFISPIKRIEEEYEISRTEYENRLRDADGELVPVIKTRYCFEYSGQLFELDIYPYSDEYAVLELELSDPKQEIFFPENINVIKDISADKAYSNAALAKAGRFPEQQDS